MDDLWAYNMNGKANKGEWKLLHQDHPPAGRRGHTFQFTEDKKMIVFGGKSTKKCLKDLKYSEPNAAIEALKNETFVISWKKGNNFIGDCRWGHSASMMKDKEGNEVMAIFGGRHENNYHINNHTRTVSNYTYYNDLIFYYPKNDTWTTILPASTVLPNKRDHHSATYAASEKKLYILGGRSTDEKSSLGHDASYTQPHILIT